MPRKVSYRAGLFDPKNLLTPNNIFNAIEEFSGVITQSNSIQALDALLEENNIVELILSGMSDEIPLRKWVIEQFPSSPKSFETSFFRKLLSRLSNFFLFQSSADDGDIFKRYHQTVGLAPEILQSLCDMTFLEATPGASSDRPGASKRFMAKSSQREKKLAAKAARNSSVNREPFEIVELSIPQTSSELAITTTSFIERLKEILEYYLSRLRTPEIFAIIQESFLQPSELGSVSEPVLRTEIPRPVSPATIDIPNAFPMVQPMKSAVYFDSPQDFGEWRILVSSRADRDLREHHKKSRDTFKIIVNKIQDLSKGHFSPDNQKRLSGPNSEVPIFEAKMTSDLRLIYQVDCVADYDTANESQVLRIFGIYTHAQMDNRLWDSVSMQLSMKGPEYRKKCLRRNQVVGDVYRPVLFGSDYVVIYEGEERPSQIVQHMAVDHENLMHRLLTLEKYVTLSQELLDSIEADRDVMFPFEVSVHERMIIQYPFSSYVLGRSGTGKTTTMLFKMLIIERAYRMPGDNTTRPRQVFVTQSRVLAGKVKELFDTYQASLPTAMAPLTDTIANIRRTAAASDEYEFLRNDADLADLGDDLPPQFSALEEKHFPLFITIDRLYAMIEADMDKSSKDRQANTFEALEGKLVTFDRFSSEYWPHFNQTSKKRLHPSLVFNEIIGVILGSQGSITASEGYLDRATYEKLPLRTQPTFANHRSAVYDIFESYQTMKHELRDFDASDRTHNILDAIRRQPLPGQLFDQLYVDETQDNLLIDAVVLRMLCRNADGLFWAGDTAQTISNGSSFRFNDLKRVMFQFESHMAKSTESGPMKRNESKEPKMFRLAVNYRSHAGIVNCAHSVIELIQRYWPYSIDILPQEQGTVVGAKPIFYRDIYPEFIQAGHFLSRDRNREKIELGADQCILVRNEAAKQRLVDEIGKIGVILTLYDSKGLEFNDVFIYNFFHDSAVDASRWRMVLNGISRESLQSSQAAPMFDPTRHAVICSELKYLYVAITRARNNLRIADESLKGESMRALWESRGDIQSCYPGDELSDFAVPSGRDEWEKRAADFFRHEKYALARDGYEKADKPKAAAISNAFYLRQVAIRTPVSRQKDGINQRTTAFRTAAEAFFSCAPDAQDPQTKRIYYRLSAKCSEQASNAVYDLSLAAKRYRLAEDFVDAAKLFRRCGRFDDLHDILVNHRDKITGRDADALEALQGIARLYFMSRKNFTKAHQLFSTFDEEMEYLEDCNFDLAQLDLLLLYGRKSEAASLHLAEGRIVEAIDLFIDDDNMERAKECVLRGLWENLSFGALNSSGVEVDWRLIEGLLKRFELLDQRLMSESDLRECEMFQVISARAFDRLSHLADFFLATGNTNAAALCLDYQFTGAPSLIGLNILQVSHILRQFWEYVQILQDLVFRVNPATEEQVRKLFAIKQQDEQFIICPGTLIHSHHISQAPMPAMKLDAMVSPVRLLSGDDLTTCFQRCMQARLCDRVTKENEVCREALGFIKLPCLRYITYGDCDPSTCLRSHHLPDISWFRQLLGLHLLQILIYNGICRIDSPHQVRSQQSFWIGRLYGILNPPHYSLGSPCHAPEKDVNFCKALTTLLGWIRKISSDPDYRQSSFLTLVMQMADLAFTFDKKQASIYMYRSSFVASPTQVPARYLRGETRQNALHELLISFNSKGSSSLLMGILFIRHIMERSIPVDINAFFAFIERICGSLIAFSRYQWKQSFHNIVLPRSWLTSIIKQFDPVVVADQDTSRFWLLLQPLKELLWAIYFSSRKSDHLLHGRGLQNTIAKQGNIVRSIYLSRVCRCLGLLFYNIGVTKFRDQIYNIFSSLRQSENHGFSRLYARYIFAEDFPAILKATRRSVQGSPLDDMVQIFHSERVQYPIKDIFGLRRIVYTKQEDLVHLLNEPSFAFAEPNKDEPENLGLDEAASEQEQEDQEDGLASEKEFDDIEDADTIPEVKIPEDVRGGHSEEEIAAALLLQSLGRGTLQRRRLLNEPGLEGDIYRWSLQCSKSFQLNVNCSYKVRFLCFAPLLLACLQALQALLVAKKKELTKQLTSAGVKHEELDEVGLTLSRASDVIKNVERLQKVLLPESELHRRGNIDELKQNIKMILDLCGPELPVQLPEDVKAKIGTVHMAMMLTASTVETMAKQNEKRPASLNTEDLADFLGRGKSWEDD